MQGFSVHCLADFAQIHFQWVGNAIYLILCCPLLLLPSIFLFFFQHQGLSQWVSSLHKVGKESIGASTSAQSLKWVFKVDLLQHWLIWSCSPRGFQESFSHHNSKALILWHSTFLIVQFSHPYCYVGFSSNASTTPKLCWRKRDKQNCLANLRWLRKMDGG